MTGLIDRARETGSGAGADATGDLSLIIVGAGAAGVELAFGARKSGWRGPITLVGNEASLPYHRPPLSKAFLLPQAELAEIALRPASAYDAAGITLRTDVEVRAIDRRARTVRYSDGGLARYGRLALCTGGRPRLLPVPGGTGLGNVYCLRTHADAGAIRAHLAPGSRLAIVGGGYVGLEVAAAARQAGAEVTVLEAQDRVLARVADAGLASFYDGVHRAMGVVIRTNAAVVAIDGIAPGRASGVRLADGTRLMADAVVVGVGMLPNVELAEAAGLAIDGGIVVDDCSVTSDPAIVAAGDCTVQDSPLYRRRVRLESVPNALEQARAAAAMLCGRPKPNRAVPWFWSDQYGYKLQVAGLHDGHDHAVIRGSMASGQFSMFYLRDRRLLAAAAVNRPGDFLAAKRLVADQRLVDAAMLADAAIPLKAMLSQAA